MEERDPLSLSSNQILVGVMRELTKEAMREALRMRTYESMIEANFIKILSQDFMPNLVREVAQEALAESMALKQADLIREEVIKEFIPQIAIETMNEEKDHLDREELEKVAFTEYLDRCILDALIQQMAENYS